MTIQEVTSRTEIPVDEAVALLDKWAALTTERSMFSSDEVLDFILDVRLAITAITETPVEELELAAV